MHVFKVCMYLRLLQLLISQVSRSSGFFFMMKMFLFISPKLLKTHYEIGSNQVGADFVDKLFLYRKIAFPISTCSIPSMETK